MKLHFHDRVRASLLGGLAGFAMVATRRWHWPHVAVTLAMTAVALVVMALLVPWVRSADDFEDQ